MAVANEMLQKPRPGPILRIAFGFFLGAAVLAKGPAAVILAGGATLLWAGLSRQWRAPFRFLHPLVIVAFCATALPWYILCASRNPDFLRIFIWQHNFERYLTPIFEHRQPFWFFGPIFLLGILPWLPLLVSALFDAGRNAHIQNGKDAPALFIGCWVLFTLLFFSLSQSKLPGYILPAIPPAILLLTRSFVRQIEQSAKGTRLAAASVGIMFPVLTGIASIKLLPILGPGQSANLAAIHYAFLAFGALLVGLGFTVAFALYRKWNGVVSAVACTTVIFLFIANRKVMPLIDVLISARPAAATLVGKYKVQPDEIAIYHLPRTYEYGLNYYFGKALPEWTPENTKAVVLFFSVDSDIHRFLDIRRGGSFDSEPTTIDWKIWWAWKKERPNHPIHPS
jgi:4-amino-4-deoxy-L-arabinose transferase-like glycosyltransferase